jgi:hypothetical protein
MTFNLSRGLRPALEKISQRQALAVTELERQLSLGQLTGQVIERAS